MLLKIFLFSSKMIGVIILKNLIDNNLFLRILGKKKPAST